MKTGVYIMIRVASLWETAIFWVLAIKRSIPLTFKIAGTLVVFVYVTETAFPMLFSNLSVLMASKTCIINLYSKW